MTRILTSLGLTAAAIGAVALPSGAAAAQYRAGTRPHTEVRMEDRGLAIADFQASAEPRTGGRVAVQMLVTARSRTATEQRVVRIARCTGSPLAVPTCKAVRSIPVTFTPTKTTIAHLNATMALPPRSVDAIRIEIDPVGKRVLPRTAPRIADAQILLGGRAWRNRAGQHFGVRVNRQWESDNQSFDVRSIDLAGTGLASDRVLARMAMTGTASAPVALKTTELPCSAVNGVCTDPARTQTTSLLAGASTNVLERPLLALESTPDGHDAHTFAFSATAAGDDAFFANLPWTR